MAPSGSSHVCRLTHELQARSVGIHIASLASSFVGAGAFSGLYQSALVRACVMRVRLPFLQ